MLGEVQGGRGGREWLQPGTSGFRFRARGGKGEGGGVRVGGVDRALSRRPEKNPAPGSLEAK